MLWEITTELLLTALAMLNSHALLTHENDIMTVGRTEVAFFSPPSCPKRSCVPRPTENRNEKRITERENRATFKR